MQHLESLNDMVGGITGIRVHETVPDTVFDEADEVVLVDVPPDELLARLKAGKVYLPQQAERAAQNFFRKGNLIALREIALRRTAEHVEDDVRSYRVEQSISAGVEDRRRASWPASARTPGAEQMVRSAARLAGQLNVRWHAAYVETPALQRLAAARARPHPGGAQAGAGSGRRHGGAGRQRRGGRAGRLCAQTLNCATLVVGRPRGRRLARWRWPRRP